MKFTIADKSKKEIFISIFQLLKNSSSILQVIFKEDRMYIQGMDNGHILLFEINLLSQWFSSYEKTTTESSNICFDSNIFYNVISVSQETDNLTIYYEGDTEPESLHIDIENDKKGEFSKYFKIPLTDLDADMMTIPETEYDVDFSISAKKINEITSQMMKFGGDTIDIKCNEEKLSATCSGGSCEMLVNIPIDDISEYAIMEDKDIDLSFSLNLMSKNCLTIKLTTEISFSLSNDMPMRIKYPLDNDDENHVVFYIAPKIKEE